jgi:hypothetical protein
VRSYVTEPVSKELDAEGFFVLPRPAAGSTRITPERAIGLAMADVTSFERFNQPYLESQRGAKIDLSTLRPDGRVFYAESPYEQDTPSDVHPSIRNHAGPYFLVTLRDATGPVLSVAVSAYATDLRIENGRLILPPNHGSNFRVQAIRADDPVGIPVSPEHAARIASQRFAARVAKVPELVLPGEGFVPQYARWRLTLDRAVALQVGRTGRRFNSNAVYVGLRGEVSVPSDSSQATAPLTSPGVDDPLTGRKVVHRVRPGYAIHFDPTTR